MNEKFKHFIVVTFDYGVKDSVPVPPLVKSEVDKDPKTDLDTYTPTKQTFLTEFVNTANGGTCLIAGSNANTTIDVATWP